MTGTDQNTENLIACYRSGQMSEAQWEQHCNDTPGLREAAYRGEECRQLDDYPIGAVVGCGSDEDGGIADVGYYIILNETDRLWIGEISRSTWDDHGGEEIGLGGDGGWFIVLHRGSEETILGKCADWMMGRDMSDFIGDLLRRSLPAPPSPTPEAGHER